MKRWITVIVIIVVLGAGALIWRGIASKEAAAVPFRMGLVSRGPVKTVVTATGTLSAVTTVAVGSQVSGTIQKLYVDFNSPVRKGEVVARLDPTFLETSVKQADANLDRAKATQTQADRDLARIKELFDKNLAAQTDYDNALTAVEQAKAGVKQMQAQLDMAKVNLAYSVIKSPIDGVVVSRNVDVGQTVAASLSAPTLFTIAQDLAQMQVETDIDEADIGGLKEGMEATFTVDAFPDEQFAGAIQQIRYAASNDQGVVTYPVILRVANPDLKLRPGMTANVAIVTAQRDEVLRLPATALRFKPPETALASNGKSDTKSAAAPAAGNGNGQALAQTPGAAGSNGQTRGQGQGGNGQGKGRGKKGADSLAVANGGAPKRLMSTVYVKGPGGKAVPKQVSVGLNDGSFAEILGGDINQGDSVIVGLSGTSAVGTKTMPGMGGGMGGPPRR
jgi:HlyD family secretion protein